VKSKGKILTIVGIVALIVGYIWMECVANGAVRFGRGSGYLLAARVAIWAMTLGGAFTLYGALMWIAGTLKDQFEAYFILLVGAKKAIGLYDVKDIGADAIAQKFNELGVPNAKGKKWSEEDIRKTLSSADTDGKIES
jgi:hypothetical protein